MEDDVNKETLYKCYNSDNYYWVKEYERLGTPIWAPNKMCPKDPSFYQVCGTKAAEISNIGNGAKILCGSYLCEFKSGKIITSDEAEIRGLICDNKKDCLNTDVDESNECFSGDNELNLALPLGNESLSNTICDGNCNSKSCEDEANCNGLSYGLYCLRNDKKRYISPRLICDGRKNCDSEEDESNCTPTKIREASHFCKHIKAEALVPVLNITRCQEVTRGGEINPRSQYCTEYVWYQTNCTDPSKIGAVCNINGYKSTVSKFMMCRNEKGCDDNLEDNCIATSKTCFLHKHFLCDEREDCADGSDETDQNCLRRTRQKCKRRSGRMEELQIPLTWLRDGFQDCVDGADEISYIWPTCGIGQSLRFKHDQATCQNVYICPSSKPGYVEFDDLCDGMETCGNENKVCSVARDSKTLFSTAMTTNNGLQKHFSYCLRGIKDSKNFVDTCQTTTFIFPDHQYFGVETRTSLILPRQKQNCDFMYGELYVYTSCTNKCINSPCPLKNIPRYEVCPTQYGGRIGTIADNRYLAFFVKSFGNIYRNTFFVCDNKVRCLEYSRVCNLVDDCGDNSDEENCTNYFKCKSTGNHIPITRKCDGTFDCADGSDECNEKCSKEILEGKALKGTCWTIGLLAAVANLVIIVKNIISLKRCQTTVALINKSLIMMISFGDLLVGGYLFVISTIDVIRLKDYCMSQIEWITSLNCSIIGVISTLGSQISLFAMCVLSVTRIHGIYNSMKIPGEVTPKKSIQVSLCLIMIMFSSSCIAVVPIITRFENFFVNGVKYAEDLKIFIGTLNKNRLMSIFEAYFSRMKSTTLSWERMRAMMNQMFSHDLNYTDATTRIAKVDFYGNDGVCLFKYFVKEDDPQRNFVWSILALNFMCFIVITLSYAVIGFISLRSSKSLTSSSGNKQITDRNRKMNMRITIIITTDFLCWVPFIVTCVLHSLEVLDATPWYSLFSVVILPINSVINPLIYDDTLTKHIAAIARRIGIFIRESRIFQEFSRRLNQLSQRIVSEEVQDRGNTDTTGEMALKET